MERLLPRFDVTAVWYNPNITDPAEHCRRLEAARCACAAFGVRLVELGYDPARFYEAVRGLEGEPEGGRRCDVCVTLRLETVAQWAEAEGLEVLATTLSVGPQKRVQQIHAAGREAAQRRGLNWLEDTFRKAGGFPRSVELSQRLGLYRQGYCGCEFGRGRGGKGNVPTDALPAGG